MHTYWECSKIVCYPCPITQLFNMQDNKGTYRESSGQCAIQLWILKKKIYGYNIYLPFTTQERHQNTYKSVFTINLHEIFMQYNTQVLLLVWGENAPPLKARASSLLDVTKSWMPVLAIECIDRLTPKIPQPAAGVDVPRELFTPPPPSDSSSRSIRGWFAASSSNCLCKKDILPYGLQGLWGWPLVLKKKVSCNSVQGDHGVYLIPFTYTQATYQMALILLKE